MRFKEKVASLFKLKKLHEVKQSKQFVVVTVSYLRFLGLRLIYNLVASVCLVLYGLLVVKRRRN